MKKMYKLKKGLLIVVTAFISIAVHSQQINNSKQLLDEVSSKMKAYKNMHLNFSTSLINEEAGINENDELPIKGEIYLQGDKYNLSYLGNNFIFDGTKLYVINHDEKEITINDEDLSEDEGFIYPSKLLTFYEEGYEHKLSNISTIKNRKIQFIELTPIDTNSEIIKVVLGIEVASKHIYQLVQFGENGTKTILTINKFKSDQNITDELFNFNRLKYETLDYLID